MTTDALLLPGSLPSRGRVLLLAAAAGVLAFLGLVPPIPQDPAYHAFADGRRQLGLPNAFDVLSNAAFSAVGLAGLRVARRRRMEPAVRAAYVALFAGTLLTSLGSAYYHLAPDDARLFWDRLPMAIAFMGLVAATLGERVGPAVAHAALRPLLAAGAASVAWWSVTESFGAGDLRPYLLVQFGSLAVVVLLLATRPGHGTREIAAGLGCYVLAKLLETLDAPVLAATGVVSGHTLKHLVAAAGIACVVAAVARRPARSVV